MTMAQKELIVGNQRGVHGRVATRLAEIAAGHGVVLSIRCGEQVIECSSILDVLALALAQGTPISLMAEGAQAEAALRAAAALIAAQDDP